MPVQAAGLALHPLQSVPRVWHLLRFCLAEASWVFPPGCCWLQNKDKALALAPELQVLSQDGG